MSSVPEEVYLKIFAGLPVKSLPTCKCVCKFWYQIISKPDFARLHHDYATRNNNNNPSIIARGDGRRSVSTYPLYAIHHDSPLSQVHHVVELDYPFKSLNRYVQIMGSTNGLICLQYRNYGTGNAEEFFCLWNPATTEFRKLPTISSHYYNDNVVYGFAYDRKTNDYKFIAVHQYFDRQKNHSYTYTLGTDSWKISQTVPYVFRICEAVLFNGALYWFGRTDEIGTSEFIISMDVGEENFKTLQLPDQFSDNKHYWSRTMGVLEERLCVFVYTEVDHEVWVMKDYGVPESWIKQYNFERVQRGYSLSFKWSFKNGKIILQHDSYKLLVLYDPKDSSARELMNLERSGFYQAEFLVESLVSLNSGTYVGR